MKLRGKLELSNGTLVISEDTSGAYTLPLQIGANGESLVIIDGEVTFQDVAKQVISKRTVVIDHIVEDDDFYIRADATFNSMVITLPDSTDNENRIIKINKVTGNNTVTVELTNPDAFSNHVGSYELSGSKEFICEGNGIWDIN